MWARFSARPDRPWGLPAYCTMGTGSFPGVKCGRGVTLTTHHLLAPRTWKFRAIRLPPLGHNWACNGVTLPLPFRNIWDYMEIFISHVGWGGAVFSWHRTLAVLNTILEVQGTKSAAVFHMSNYQTLNMNPCFYILTL